MKGADRITTGLALAGLIWAATVIAGMVLVISYDAGPGAQGTAVSQWPDESAVPQAESAPQLLMFAHPRCSCTRASIGELARIMTQAHGRVHARVLLFAPRGHDDSWLETDLLKSAERIPGVTVSVDIDGEEARRFGVITSGHTMLFEIDGRRVFSGGITESRGHAGDNVGRSVVVSHLTGRPSLVPGAAGRTQCAVYGCAIFKEESS